MFGGGFEAGALEILAEAGEAIAPTLPPQPAPEAPEAAAYQEAAVDADGAASEMDEKRVRMEAVARGIKPGCKHWNLKDPRFPKADKPSSEVLRAEVIRRDPKRRPAAWSVPDLCKWLHEHPPLLPHTEAGGDADAPALAACGTPTQHSLCDEHGVAQTTARRVPPPATPTPPAEDQEQDDPKSRRWVNTKQTVRLVHCIVENKIDFLIRDQKPASRTELEGVDRKWFWHKLARTFNDSSFNPPLCQSRADNTDFSTLTPMYDGYPGTAVKLEQEFMKVRKRLTVALANFRQSGMGDGGGAYDGAEKEQDPHYNWTDEQERNAKSVKIYSSRFKNFLQGDIVAEYAYDRLVGDDGLLESSAADMPAETTASSEDAKPRTTSGPARPRENARGKGKVVSLSPNSRAAMMQPIRMHKTQHEQQRDFYAAQTARLKFLAGSESLMLQKEKALLEVTVTIRSYTTQQIAPPERLVKRKQDLEQVCCVCLA